MFKPQLKFQKILFLVLLILQALLFIYSVGLATDFYPLYLAEAYGKLPGSVDFFEEIQVYNSQLIKVAIVMIVLSLMPFIFSSTTRRKYYIDNFITQVIQAAAYVGCSIFLIINSIAYKARFYELVNIDEYKALCTEMGWYYTGTTIFLDLGFVFAGILIASAIVIVINYIWKKKLEKTEEQILNGEFSEVR